jgi:MFS family permease
VYLQRVHGYTTGESGTVLAIAIGLFGGLGTFFGGYFADRLARRNEGWRSWIVSLAALIYLPFGYLSITAQDPFWAAAWFFGPAIFGGVYLGTNFAILQSQLPVEMRSVGAAINLFILNIIGLGLGPLSVGAISDATAAADGIDSIRNGLLAMLFIMLWGAVHQWRTGILLSRNK